MKNLTLIIICLLCSIDFINGQENNPSIGTKVGTHVKDAFEAVLPGGGLLVNIIDAIFDKPDTHDDERKRFSAEQLKEKIKSTNNVAIQNINQKLKPIQTAGDQAAYLANLHTLSTECRKSYIAVLSKLIATPSSIEVEAALNRAQAKAKQLASIKVNEINDKFKIDIGTYSGLSKMVDVVATNSGYIEILKTKNYKTNTTYRTAMASYIAEITNEGITHLDVINTKVGLDLLSNLKGLNTNDNLIAALNQLNHLQATQAISTSSVTDYWTKDALENVMSKSKESDYLFLFNRIDSKEKLEKLISEIPDNN